MCIIVAIFPLDYIAVVRLISVIVFDLSLPAPSQMSLGILRLTINDTSARRQPLPQPPPPTTSVNNAACLEREEDATQSNTTHVHMPQTPQMPPTLTIRMPQPPTSPAANVPSCQCPQPPTIVSAGVRHIMETPPYVLSVYQPPNVVTNQVGAQPCVNRCHVIDPHPQPLSSSPIRPHPAPSMPINIDPATSMPTQIRPCPSMPIQTPSTPIHTFDGHPRSSMPPCPLIRYHPHPSICPIRSTPLCPFHAHPHPNAPIRSASTLVRDPSPPT